MSMITEFHAAGDPNTLTTFVGKTQSLCQIGTQNTHTHYLCGENWPKRPTILERLSKILAWARGLTPSDPVGDSLSSDMSEGHRRTVAAPKKKCSNGSARGRAEGTETQPDYLVITMNRADQKNERLLGENNCTKIEKWL